MLLIYTEKVSPRFSYICQHIFVNLLGLKMEITSNLEDFVKSDAYKISYAKAPIGNEFFIKNFGLLFEKGIREIDVYVNYWDDIPYFFSAKKGSIPFDILSATFYLLSRYEEYMSFSPDKNGNFPPNESLAYKYQFLEMPVVDIWVQKLAQALQEKYPEIEFKAKKFQQSSVIEVAQAFKYKYKGIIRLMMRLGANLFSLKFHRVWEQIQVMLRLKKDPYDFYAPLICLHQREKISSVFFFLLANYSFQDKGISFYNLKYQDLIKYIADYCIVSVLASYDAVFSSKEMKTERERMISIINRPVKRFRANKNHVIVPEVYQRASESEYNEDYSMGYTSHLGFRAGTCSPFYFYDISMELKLPILVNSFCLHSDAIHALGQKKTLEKLQQLKKQVQKVDGHWVTIFNNDFFGKSRSQAEFDFYKKIITL